MFHIKPLKSVIISLLKEENYIPKKRKSHKVLNDNNFNAVKLLNIY